MSDPKKILVAEDELPNSILLKRLLTKAGYNVVVTHNGQDALKQIEREQFDAILTDWMMPQMDGIELIRKIRQNINPLPLIIMITALVSDGARSYAIESGADDYIAKPIDVDELLARVKDGLDKKLQQPPGKFSQTVTRELGKYPPFVGVSIATSTGGPPTLIDIFRNIPENIPAAFFIVQHGPPWMLDTFSQRLQRETGLKVNLTSNDTLPEKGSIYIAPGDKHLKISAHTFRLMLDDSPKENFVRPSADPLFRSTADAFGKYCIGLILTGLGRDGASGAAQIASVNGTIIVQDPATCVAPSMPRTIIESGVNHKLVTLADLSSIIIETVNELDRQLIKIIKQGAVIN
jgi:two-component system chemotaxis response regulator CheB